MIINSLKDRVITENYMDYLGICGIVLIRDKDPLSLICLRYTGISYSHIGFYYRKIINNTINYFMVIIQTFSLPEVSIKKYDLKNYIATHSIDEITYKSYENNSYELFNSSVAYLESLHFNYPKKDLVLSFLRSKFYSFDIFNSIMKRIDNSVKINPKKSFDRLLDSVYFGIEKKMLLNNKLPNKTKENFKRQFFDSVKMVSEFLVESSEAQDIVFGLWKNGKDTLLIEIEDSLSNYIDSSNQLFSIIMRGIRNKKIDPEELVKCINIVDRDYKYIHPDDIEVEYPIEIKGRGETDKVKTPRKTEEKYDITLFNEAFSEEKVKNVLIVLDNKKRTVATNNMKAIFTQTLNSIVNGEIPTIKLDKLISNFNVLMEEVDPSFKPIKVSVENTSSYGLILIGDSNTKNIPIQLKTGDKMIIPMNETNYSRFTIEQLEEILIILDVYSNGDSKFDGIRSIITKELANKITNSKNEI